MSGTEELLYLTRWVETLMADVDFEKLPSLLITRISTSETPAWRIATRTGSSTTTAHGHGT